MIKQLKLLAIVPVAVLATFAQINLRSLAQNAPARLFEIVGMNVPFQERVGADDGAVFAVHFSGDTRGNLDTCG
jgi:hypothetical protein